MRQITSTFIIAALCACTIKAQTSSDSARWYLLTPTAFTYDLNAVAFCDHLNAWALGDRGSCLRTTDGGLNWIPESTGTQGTFVGAAALGGRVFAIGDDGLWVRGPKKKPWRKVDLDLIAPKAITAVAKHHLWIVGDSGEVFHSKDDGQTWERRDIGVKAFLTNVTFADPENGYLIGWTPGGGMRLFQTHDGGETWTNKVQDGWMYDQHLAALSPNVLFWTGQVDAGPDATTAQIQRSTNRGETFKLIEDGIYGMDAVCFRSPSVGLISGGAFVRRTDDSGKTWSITSLSAGTPSKAIAAFNSTTFIHAPLSEETFVLAGMFGRISRSTDGGKTWKLTHNDVYPSIWVVEAISCSSAVLGTSNGMYRTDDAGSSWQKTLPEAGTSLDFVNDTLAFFAQRYGIIYCTLDGGRTWNSIGDASPYNITDIAFVDAQHGCFIGGDLLRYTEDGGKTWTSKWWLKRVPFTGIDFADSSHGWTVAQHSVVLRSTDGGRSWEQTPAPDPTNPELGLTRVKFLDSLNGWVSADDGKLFRTRNGGDSWSKLPKLDSTWNQRVHFVDTLSGWTCSGQKLLKTHDGGLTWHEQSTPNTWPLADVSMFSPDCGWAIGRGWMILGTHRPTDDRIPVPPRVGE